MKLLVLGYSDFARRRVLPALARLGLGEVDIASRTRVSRVAWPEGLAGRSFADHDDALRHSDAAVAYISTANATHEDLAAAALERGLHVIVDKPAFTTLGAARRLAALAQARGRCLAEATVYGHHPRLLQAVRELAGAATRLSAVFSFPPVAADNFRYRAELGGGAIADLGPYAVTPGRLFFREAPETVDCRVLERRGAVEAAFSVIMTYSGGRVMIGHYGMTTAYVHRLDAFGPDVAVGLERVFSPPPERPSELHVTRGALARETIVVPPADSVALFVREVLASIARGDLAPWRDALLADAAAMERLREAAG